MAVTHQPSPHDVIAYVSFGKTGSSSMRQLLQERVRAHCWEQLPGPASHLGHRRLDQPCAGTLCTCNGPCVRESPLKCAEAPAGYVVAANYGYGWCEARRAQMGRTDCRYVTVLREPVARLTSDCNYFCLSCAEGGRRCVRDPQQLMRAVQNNSKICRDARGVACSQPTNSCPRMGILVKLQPASHAADPPPVQPRRACRSPFPTRSASPVSRTMP